MTMKVPSLPAVQRITSTQNSYVQHCVRLRTTRRYRDSCQRLLLVGKDIIQEVIDSGAKIKTRSVFLSEGVELNIQSEMAEEVYTVTENVMARLSGMKSAAPVGAVVELDIPCHPQKWTGSHVLALDGVQDPGNFGTLLRTCVSFGWGPVLLLPNCVDAYNDKALKAARGATFKVPVHSVSHVELGNLLENKGLMAVGAAVQNRMAPTVTIGEVQRREGVCLILGSEGRGLSEDAKQLCNDFISIPQSREMESLNVAVAGGILMYLLNSALHGSDS